MNNSSNSSINSAINISNTIMLDIKFPPGNSNNIITIHIQELEIMKTILRFHQMKISLYHINQNM